MYQGRLDVRGTYGIWPRDDGATFDVGNKDAVNTYRIETRADGISVVNVGLDCIGYGRVHQRLVPNGNSTQEWLCCSNTTASVIDEAGNAVSG